MKTGKYNQGIISTVPAWGDGVMLQAMWQVDEDLAYQVNRRSANATWILLRTLSGAGRLTTADGVAYELSAATVLLLDNRHIRHYGTSGKAWRFDWFEFAAAEPLFRPGKIFPLPADGFENDAVNRMAELLRRQDRSPAAAASALLGWLLRWYAVETGAEPTAVPPRDRRIAAAIETMGRRLDVPLKIAAMARQQGMCDRAFRTLFRRETGCSPKQYYDRLRLCHAGEMLASGEYNVEQTAARLGFSSPFHFSMAFKQHFGVAPSHYRGGNS